MKEQESERLCPSMKSMKTQKWYYLHNTRSAYFPIDRRLHRERERERVRERERERE